MHHPAREGSRIRFGSYELDVSSGELRKGPTRLKVPYQSIQILAALLERPGELVTREQLRERLWARDTFVDSEHGLNAAMRRLRDVLSDSADAPTFIETLPRRGYRFIGVVEGGAPSATTAVEPPVESPSGVAEPAAVAADRVTEATAARSPSARSWSTRWQLAAMALALCAMLAARPVAAPGRARGAQSGVTAPECSGHELPRPGGGSRGVAGWQSRGVRLGPQHG